MTSALLFPEETIHDTGFGPTLTLGPSKGQPLQLNLDILSMCQHHVLDIAIYGSADGVHWGAAPIRQLPHRYYCGHYSESLDLSNHPAVRYLRAEYALRSWSGRPSFNSARIQVVLEPAHEEALVMAAG